MYIDKTVVCDFSIGKDYLHLIFFWLILRLTNYFCEGIMHVFALDFAIDKYFLF